MSEVKPVHRYKAQTMFSFGGAKIEYFPRGPDVVMASEYDAQRLRADTAEAELKTVRESHESMRADLISTEAKLAAAEQRISALAKALKDIRENSDDIDACECAADALKDAALNPNPEAESHEIARNALKMENQRITPERFKCLACGDYHEGSGNLPCPKMTPYARTDHDQ